MSPFFIPVNVECAIILTVNCLSCSVEHGTAPLPACLVFLFPLHASLSDGKDAVGQGADWLPLRLPSCFYSCSYKVRIRMRLSSWSLGELAMTRCLLRVKKRSVLPCSPQSTGKLSSTQPIVWHSCVWTCAVAPKRSGCLAVFHHASCGDSSLPLHSRHHHLFPSRQWRPASGHLSPPQPMPSYASTR